MVREHGARDEDGGVVSQRGCRDSLTICKADFGAGHLDSRKLLAALIWAWTTLSDIPGE